MSREQAPLDHTTTCCRPSEVTRRPGMSFQQAEFDEGLRARFVDEECQRRQAARTDLLSEMQRLLDRFALTDILEDLRTAFSLRAREGEQDKQTLTLRNELDHVARLAGRYGQ